MVFSYPFLPIVLVRVTPTAKRNSYRVAMIERPLPNPPQREGVPSNRIKHSKNGLPPLGRALKKSPIPCK